VTKNWQAIEPARWEEPQLQLMIEATWCFVLSLPAVWSRPVVSRGCMLAQRRGALGLSLVPDGKAGIAEASHAAHP
jgi:hypothetical protein